jgi:hypothetical protein
MDRHERLVAVQEAGRAKISRLKGLRAGPACHFCIHGPENGAAKGICGHPIHHEAKADAVTGGFSTKSLVSTLKARSESGLCGPEGLLFEPRPVPVRIWRALRPHLPF